MIFFSDVDKNLWHAKYTRNINFVLTLYHPGLKTTTFIAGLGNSSKTTNNILV